MRITQNPCTCDGSVGVVIERDTLYCEGYTHQAEKSAERRRIKQLVGTEVTCIELFARGSQENQGSQTGWDQWGNQPDWKEWPK